MPNHDRLALAATIMARFAARTGLTSPVGRERRYLWTDAYAVCTLLALQRATGAAEPGRQAAALVARVHDVLGRHRPDDARRGWISGLGDAEGRRHPTVGGLRIGKPLPERRLDEPFDERLEWDRDGQYFHYLTRWMHALAAMARASSDEPYLQWALELAQSAHAAFTATRADGRRSMRWKMSIDLTRPLVPSTGHHDPLDGLLTFLALRAELRARPGAGDPAVLDAAIADLRAMATELDPTTHDVLGIGGLLVGLGGLAQLSVHGHDDERALFATMLRSAVLGMSASGVEATLRQPTARRLAFRELGLAIGLQAVAGIQQLCRAQPQRFGAPSFVQSHLAALAAAAQLVPQIVDFWCAHRDSESWQAHLDIDEVMLATALVPAVALAA